MTNSNNRLKILFIAAVAAISLSACDKDEPHKTLPKAPPIVGQWYNLSHDAEDCEILDIRFEGSKMTSFNMEDAEIKVMTQGSYETRKTNLEYTLENGRHFDGTFTANDSVLLLTQDSENITRYNRIPNGFSIKSLIWHYTGIRSNIKASGTGEIVLPEGMEYRNSGTLSVSDLNENFFTEGLSGLVSKLRFITDLKAEQYYTQGKETKTLRKNYEYQDNVLKMSFSIDGKEGRSEAMIVPSYKGKNKKEAINLVFTRNSTAQLATDILLQNSDAKVSGQAVSKLKSDILAAFDKLNVTLRMEAE